MDTSSPVGDQITDAITLAIQVLESQVAVLRRAKARLEGGSSSSDDEEPRRGRRSTGEPKKRGPARKVDDQAILDYLKQTPSSVKTMAEALGLTLSAAHKRVKELSKSLKRVKEGTSVIYIIKPRRNAKAEKTGNAKAEKTGKANTKAASTAN